jgi:hypothetical protein
MNRWFGFPPRTNRYRRFPSQCRPMSVVTPGATKNDAPRRTTLCAINDQRTAAKRTHIHGSHVPVKVEGLVVCTSELHDADPDRPKLRSTQWDAERVLPGSPVGTGLAGAPRWSASVWRPIRRSLRRCQRLRRSRARSGRPRCVVDGFGVTTTPFGLTRRWDIDRRRQRIWSGQQQQWWRRPLYIRISLWVLRRRERSIPADNRCGPRRTSHGVALLTQRSLCPRRQTAEWRFSQRPESPRRVHRWQVDGS